MYILCCYTSPTFLRKNLIGIACMDHSVRKHKNTYYGLAPDIMPVWRADQSTKMDLRYIIIGTITDLC